jgi:hypothetical protein
MMIEANYFLFLFSLLFFPAVYSLYVFLGAPIASKYLSDFEIHAIILAIDYSFLPILIVIYVIIFKVVLKRTRNKAVVDGNKNIYPKKKI